MSIRQSQEFLSSCDHLSLGSNKTMRGRHAILNRVCSNCGSNKTREYLKDGYKCYDWRKDENGNILCKNCRSKLIDTYDSRKEYFKNIANPRVHARVFRYKNKFVYIPGESLRIGTCSHCGRSKEKGEIKVTNLHHIEYDDNSPLAHTIELCVRCHNRITHGILDTAE